MPIETRIDGSPASIRRAAVWLSETLAPAIDAGAEQVVGARRTAGAEWLGRTGTAFCGALGRGVLEIDDVRAAAAGVGTTFAEHAAALEVCQGRMADIRSEASAGGLTVSGTRIEEPGPGPARPVPPDVLPQGRLGAYEAAAAAYAAHQERVRLYERLAQRADAVRTDMERAWQEVSGKQRALDAASWTFSLADVAGGLGGALLEAGSSAMRGTAEYFRQNADEALQRLLQQAQDGRVTNAARFYDDLDHYRTVGAAADDTLDEAARLARIGKAAPSALGGVLAVGGVWYDHQHGGESIEQAAASNLGGFAASVGTGALVGTAIGGPVGTVIGTVVGAGVGVLTSGVIDGLWDHDGDVSDALMAGVDTLVDTGEALADVGGAIVDGIGGLFD